MKKLLLTVYSKMIDALSLTTFMANHVFGKHHTKAHRRFCGLLVMVFGVSLYRFLGTFNNIIFHFLADIVGFAYHGIGLAPFISSLESK